MADIPYVDSMILVFSSPVKVSSYIYYAYQCIATRDKSRMREMRSYAKEKLTVSQSLGFLIYELCGFYMDRTTARGTRSPVNMYLCLFGQLHLHG